MIGICVLQLLLDRAQKKKDLNRDLGVGTFFHLVLQESGSEWQKRIYDKGLILCWNRSRLCGTRGCVTLN